MSQVNTRRDYIEACLYTTTSNGLKDYCYDVYPANHSRDAVLWGVISLLGAIFFITIFIASKPRLEQD